MYPDRSFPRCPTPPCRNAAAWYKLRLTDSRPAGWHASRQAADGRYPIYLETLNRDNLSFYERQGFTEYHPEVFAEDGPTVWYMVREPVPLPSLDHPKGEKMISTERLVMRPFKASDAADLHEYLSDPLVYRYEPGEPISLDRSLQLAQERATATDFWAIELKDSSKMIGHLYFKQVEPLEFRTWELGYIVSPAHQGKGVATEAATALLQNAFKEKNVHRVFAHCNPENIASWKALEKVGLRREGLLRKNVFFRKGTQGEELWTDTYEYAILEDEADEKLNKKGLP